jgi:3-deoxy-D-manno-octulosonic-acid transferase
LKVTDSRLKRLLKSLTYKMLKVYRHISKHGSVLWRMSLKSRVKKGKEDLERIQERLGIPSVQKPNGRIVWVHAASVGETLSILPVLKAYEDVTFVITTQTQSSARILKDRAIPNVIHQFYPVDSFPYIKRFLDYWQPVLCLRVESELWPEAIMQIHERNIPHILVNARFSRKSAGRWKRLRKTFMKLCDCFDGILTQNESITENFLTLAPNANVKTAGNLKFLSDPLPFDTNELERMRDLVRGQTVWLAASTHTGEEDSILKTHGLLQKTHPHTLTILVPRHVERREDIEALCREQNISYTMRSRGEKPQGVYIADTLGELGIWYRLSPVSFIAGSLRPKIGGHNPIEPAQLKTVIISGRYVANARDEYALFWRENAAFCANEPEKIAEHVVSVWEGKVDVKSMVETAYTITQQSKNVLDIVQSELEQYLYDERP